MRTLLWLYPGDNIAILVANVAWQIAAVVTVAAIASRAVARRNAATRHAIWLCALGCVVLSPAVAWTTQRADLALIDIPWSSATSAVHSATSGRLRAGLGGFFAVWIAGTLFLVARIVWGWCWLSALRRHVHPIDRGELGGLAEHVAAVLHLSSVPPVMQSTVVASPVSLGLVRPLVILPSDLVESLSCEQVQDVLIHEYAHIARRDHGVGLLQRIVQAALWPHPLITILNRELSISREELCDNYVLQCGEAPRYARTLLTITERVSAVPRELLAMGLLSPRWRLEERVAGLLDPRRRCLTAASGLTVLPVFLGLVIAITLIATTRLSTDGEPQRKAASASEANSNPRLNVGAGLHEDATSVDEGVREFDSIYMTADSPYGSAQLVIMGNGTIGNDYRRAMRDLYLDSQRLEIVGKSEPQRYESELHASGLDFRMRRSAARLGMTEKAQPEAEQGDEERKVEGETL